MKKKGIIWLILLATLILSAKYSLELYWTHAIGLGLVVWLAVIVFLHLITKAINKKNPKAEENSYILPDKVAKKMKLIDMRVQYEASIMATVFIILGMITFTIYLIFFTQLSNWYKFFIAFNSFWGVVFLGSSLITVYQQYNYYMISKKVIEESNDLLSIPQNNNLKGGIKT